MVEVEDRIDELKLASPLAERFVREVTEGIASAAECYSFEVEEVETNARDGFIPFTDGGFNGIAYSTMRSVSGTGTAPAVVQADIDRTIKDAEVEFEREHGISVASLYDHEGATDHPMMEKWWDYQDSWLEEGGTFFYKIKALFYESDNSRNELGTAEVRLFAYLNTDYEYGRDNISWLACYGSKTDQTSGTWEKTMTAAEFIALGDDGIDALIAEATLHLECL